MIGEAAQRRAAELGERARPPAEPGAQAAGADRFTPAQAWAALVVAVAGAVVPGCPTGGPWELLVVHPAGWTPDALSVLGRALEAAGLPAPRFVPRAVCVAEAADAAAPADPAAPAGKPETPPIPGEPRTPATRRAQDGILAVVTDDGADFEVAVLERTRGGLRLAGPGGGLGVDADRPADATARALGHELLATLAGAGLPPDRLAEVVLSGRAAAGPHVREAVGTMTGVPVRVASDIPGGAAGAALAAYRLGRGERVAHPGRPARLGNRRLIACAAAVALVLAGLGAYALARPRHPAATPSAARSTPGSPRQGGSPAAAPGGTAGGSYDVYVADQQTDSLSRVDTATGQAGPPVQLGSCQWPSDVVVSSDRKQAFVECAGAMIRPVDLATGTVGPPITLPSQGNNDLVFSPDGSVLYALSVDDHRDAGAVTPIDTRTGKAGRSVPVTGNVHTMAVTPDGRHVYVLDYGTGGGATGSVTDVDTTRGTASGPIPLGKNPTAIVLTPDGLTAYIACSDSGFVVPLATATDTAGQPIPLAGGPVRLAITPDSRTLYALVGGLPTASGTAVTPIDTATGVTGTPIDVVGNDMAITPDGRQVFVFGSAIEAAADWFDTATGRLRPRITVGTYPSGLAFSADGTQAFILKDGTGSGDPVTTVVPVALPSGRTGKPIKILPGAGVIAVAAPRVRPHPVPTRTAPVVSPTTGADTGAGCGAAGTSPSGGSLVLTVTSGSVTCAEARKVLGDYRASHDREGSGGFATVDGWDCGHDSVAGFEHSGEYESCQRGGAVFRTRAA
ncbi:hypothetical protein [Actinacidiphila paucisporea]|uniref:hypothetical protein n=1 Tax=Actinacidiphila paucisporea TaxID=310782 RepID=UPI0009365F9E|nr:hypothetical protein [Actinacidiphila paucisporea]